MVHLNDILVTCSTNAPQVLEFFSVFGESSFYGARRNESVESLALSILPSPGYQFRELMQEAATTRMQHSANGPLVLLTALINALQQEAGFHFVKVGRLL